jgi:Ribbon-helix-helix domain
MEEEPVRWSVTVSKETDLILRTFLGAQGMKKGDLSKFIEEAVRWRVFNRTVQNIKARNVGINLDHLQELVDEALGDVRLERLIKQRPDEI